MKRIPGSDTFARGLLVGVAGILLLIPFHALFTTWLGSNFGHLDVWRIWKEVIIALLVPVSLGLIYTTPRLKRWFHTDTLIKLSLLYVLMHVLRGLVAVLNSQVSAEALIFGLLINLRFLAFFGVAYCAATRYNWLKRHWQALVFWPAALVIGFGVMQQFVLPQDFLTHFGYGPDTIAAVQTVDQKPTYVRLQSTLRGANPLGAYLLVILTLLLSSVFTKRSWRNWRMALLVLSGGLVLLLTYSRSAWLGLAASIAILSWSVLQSSIAKRILLLTAMLLVIIGSSVVWLLRDNNTVQNVVFHSDETSLAAQSSNQARQEAIREGVQTIIREPLGRGPGTAGPASQRNQQADSRIAENYFIQIGQEVGIFGLILFVAISVIAGTKLWKNKNDPLSLGLACSLVGISVVCLFLHAWADDTLSLLWWGLAGMALAPTAVILKSKHEQKANSD